MGNQVKHQPTGMVAFTIVWAGQMVSMLGTGMTRFAITIWAWQVTGEATALAMVAFFSFAPLVILSPVAGALVDRWNRKLVMMLSDVAAGLATIAVFLLFMTGNLQIWHLYVAGAWAGAFEAFQFPAYSAAITTMLPKEQYARANGMFGLIEPTSQIVSPILAGFLLAVIGLGGILIIDILTFSVAVGMLLVVFVPKPVTTEAGRKGQGNLWKESLYGFQYIFERPSLLGLQLIFLAGNFISAFGFVLFPAMILARTDNNEVTLAMVQAALGIGGIVGGLVLSIWGGPRRKIHSLLISWILVGLVGQVIMGVGQQLMAWFVGHFLIGFFIPFINGSNQAIWQAKVAPDVQGRVFSARRLIAQITFPVAMLIAGPLVDYVFEPAMMPEGQLAGSFGNLVGVGPGAGMGLIFAISGFLVALVGVSGYLFPAIRNIEDILPDYDMIAPVDGTEREQAGTGKIVEAEGAVGSAA